MDQAAEVANYVAPEHLELQVADNTINALTKKIRTAGAILQGYLTPTVLGDFTAGQVIPCLQAVPVVFTADSN